MHNNDHLDRLQDLSGTEMLVLKTSALLWRPQHAQFLATATHEIAKACQKQPVSSSHSLAEYQEAVQQLVAKGILETTNNHRINLPDSLKESLYLQCLALCPANTLRQCLMDLWNLVEDDDGFLLGGADSTQVGLDGAYAVIKLEFVCGHPLIKPGIPLRHLKQELPDSPRHPGEWVLVADRKDTHETVSAQMQFMLSWQKSIVNDGLVCPELLNRMHKSVRRLAFPISEGFVTGASDALVNAALAHVKRDGICMISDGMLAGWLASELMFRGQLKEAAPLIRAIKLINDSMNNQTLSRIIDQHSQVIAQKTAATE